MSKSIRAGITSAQNYNQIIYWRALIVTLAQLCKALKLAKEIWSLSAHSLPSERKTQGKARKNSNLAPARWQLQLFELTHDNLFWAGAGGDPNNKLFHDQWKKTVFGLWWIFALHYLLNPLPLANNPDLAHGFIFSTINFQSFWKFLPCSFHSPVPSQSLHSLWWAKDSPWCSYSHVLTALLGQHE